MARRPVAERGARSFRAGSFRVAPRHRVRAELRVGRPMIDVNALIGPYPFRHVPHPDPDVLVRVLEREGLERRVGRASAVGVLSRSRAGQRGAASTRSRRIAPRCVRRPVVRPDWPRLGARARDAASSGRAGDPRLSAAVGAGRRRSGDARARGRVRRGWRRTRAHGALRGPAPAAPARRRRRPAARRTSGRSPAATDASASSSPPPGAR